MEIVQLALRQHGVVADRQLRELGMGRGAIQHWLALGRLHRVHRGVYAVGYPRLTLRGRWMAAVLTAGDEALLSHTDAGALWGILPPRGSGVHVTVVARGRAKQRGITLHQVRSLHPDDEKTLEGIPVTSLPRTFLDLAEVLRPPQLARAWEEADRLRVLDVHAVRATCHRSPGRRGLKPLNALITENAYDAPATKRELEARLYDLCREYRLPLPACNVLVEGYVVDAFWPAARLIVELDSWEFHHTRQAFERDRERDTRLQAAGFRVMRITWRRLKERPDEVAALLRGML